MMMTPADKQLMLDGLRALSTIPKRAYVLIVSRYVDPPRTTIKAQGETYRDLTPDQLIAELADKLPIRKMGERLRVEIFEEPMYGFVFDGDADLANKIDQGPGWKLVGDITNMHRLEYILNGVRAIWAERERIQQEAERKAAERAAWNERIKNATPAELAKELRHFRRRRIEGDRMRSARERARREGWI